MPRFGVEAATFAQSWNCSGALRAIDAAAHLGFDALEIPLSRAGVLDTTAMRAAAQKAGVRLICRTALPANCSVLQHAERARVHLGLALREAQALGAESLAGALLYTPGTPGPTATPGDGALLVEVLADVAQEAEARGLLLALEPAHRFESPIVNSVAQALALIHAVGADNLRLGLSTLQVHIGEASVAEALREVGPLLYSVRMAENTGGPLGSGAVQWDALWHGLAALHFDGLLILDAPLPNPTAGESSVQLNRVVAATELYPEEFAADGLAFLRQGIDSRPAPGALQAVPETTKSTSRAPSKRSKSTAVAASEIVPASPATQKRTAARSSPRSSAPRPSGAKSYRSR